MRKPVDGNSLRNPIELAQLVLAIIIITTSAYMYATGQTVDQSLQALDLLVLGYYFGKSAQ